VSVQCHTLFDIGGKVGPDLTGSNRADVGYLLSNIIDPSSVISKDYMVSVIKMKDNRVLSGLVKSDDGNVVMLQTETEVLSLPKANITLQKQQNISMMPEGLLAGLKNEEVRDLMAYMGGAKQVPMMATEQNAAGFFNGKDLVGWIGDAKRWRVENGEIVGSAPEGLKKNECLFSGMAATDFRLTLKVKLADNKGNSGIQFRSEQIEDGLAKGYQADIGPGWWGKLYEEHGRELLSPRSGEEFIKPGEWNSYEIVAVGSKIMTAINGHKCVDLDDPEGARTGVFALQLHSGGPTEVRFKDLKLELHPKPELSGAAE
jgi:putative heme-binding domain-containing protein